MGLNDKKAERALFFSAVIAVLGMVAAATPESIAARTAETARLVSVKDVPAGAMCAWDSPVAPLDAAPFVARDTRFAESMPGVSAGPMMALLPGNLLAALQQARPALPAALNESKRSPAFRRIADTYPTYTAVGVNLQTDEVILQDNNLWSTRVFNRLDNTPPGGKATEPKRIIQGEETFIQFNNGVYIDPSNGDIYSVESDTGDKMVVFSHDARGNVAPKRVLATPHRVYSIAIDEVKKELYVTVEYPPEIVVYRKEAAGDEAPLRRIQGDRTQLKTPHGIVVDVKNQLLYVNNWGHYTSFRNPGTGRFDLPAINVYALDASGDAAPLRVIQGDRTRLNWPGNMTLHPDTGELYVANDVDQSILVFRGMAYIRGDVPPARVLKGDKTSLTNPTGVFIDTKHQELWVSNLGNASATVYPLLANGNVAPLRTIRSGPPGHLSLTFGRTAAVAYDINRQEILVPN